MFFTTPEIIEELDAIRHRLCHYGRDNVHVRMCDCKFYMHGSPNGEFSGCAELEQLIRHLKGEPDFQDRLTEVFNDNA